MVGITKYFPGVVANDNIHFEVTQGEIHALVGENGAGKSTLMKILYGMEKADAGHIYLKGEQVTVSNPQTAISLGIDMVHQHFQLVPSLSVAENVTLGYEPHRGPFVNQSVMNTEVAALSERFGLKVDPTAQVSTLSVGVQQRVEILKLLYRNAELLILDEPSAVLTPQEVKDLFEILRRLVDEGRTVIFITHKLREVMAICERATILRNGKTVGTLTVADTTPETIAQMMVGRDLKQVQRPTTATQTGTPRLIVRDLHADDNRGLPALRSINLTVNSGEIVGLAGVEGNGQRELIETLVGLRFPTQGDIVLSEEVVTRLRNRQRRARGLALIPEDRTHEGLSPDSTLTENVVSTRYHKPPLSRWGMLIPQHMRHFTRRTIDEFDIRVRGPNVRVRTLSGGNAQKVVIGRELSGSPQVLLAAQPTRGLDIGATQFVHEELLRLRAEDTAILLISADLDEILLLSDRIAVIYEGQIVNVVDQQDADIEQLGLMMTGVTADSGTPGDQSPDLAPRAGWQQKGTLLSSMITAFGAGALLYVYREHIAARLKSLVAFLRFRRPAK